MKVVVQRVSRGKVSVDGEISGQISNGLLVLLGIHGSDDEETIDWMCQKLSKLRVFEDENERMNLSVEDIDGELLIVPQFTLYGDVSKGTRPSFTDAAKPGKAKKLYNQFVEHLKQVTEVPVETGVFGAYMDVEMNNDGPVTIIIEK
ncbi:MAG: D-aminoacyl-tRNA deacylase [Bacteroidota bacterium]